MKDKLIKIKSSQEGTILIYAVFVMLALGTIVMLMSFVIFMNMRTTANSTKAMTAYYAAESGLENSLYIIQKNRNSKIYSLTDTITEIDANSTASLTASDSSYEVEVTQEQDTIEFNLPFPGSKQIDLYDPDDGSPLITSTGTIYIDWEAGDDCDASGPCNLELSYKDFDRSNWRSSIENEDYMVYVLPCSCTDTAPECSDSSISLTGNYGYRIKLKSLNCSYKNVQVQVVSGPSPIIFDNYLTITSTGKTGKSSAALRADTIWKPPLSGLGEYVLFSEQDITK